MSEGYICTSVVNKSLIFGKRRFSFGFSNTSPVESLDIFRKTVFENVYIDIDHLKGGNSLQEE